MPQLGETVTEGTILRWLVKVGDEVKEDDPILEISTDKVDTEVPSPFNGTVTSLLVEEGETVEVGASLLELDGSAKESSNDKSETAEEVQETVEEIVKEDTPKEDVLPKTHNVRNTKNLKLSPVVRRLASENNIDLNNVVGTGQNGRIKREDIENYINEISSTGIQTLQGKKINFIDFQNVDKKLYHAYYRFTILINNTKIKKGNSRDTILTQLINNKIPATVGVCPELYKEKVFHKRQ